ncbi:MAG: hypothetical protein KatS3mg067_0574 [Thermosynechococcus sp.]|nr:MAG: hypothetical protein KatS3mg067_0574 [Thermosynechococcus sp.]
MARFFLPTFLFLGGNLGEDQVTGRTIPPRHRLLARRYAYLHLRFAGGSMHCLGVVSAIGTDFGNVAFDFREQVRKDFTVVPVGSGDLDADDVLLVVASTDRSILRQVQRLSAPCWCTLPFTFTENLQTDRVHHDMDRTCSPTMWNLHFQRGRLARQMSVIQHRQVQPTQAHQGVHQPFRSTIGRTGQNLDHQTELNGPVRIKPRPTSPVRRKGRPVLGNVLLIKLDRLVAMIDQCMVIFRLVLHLVAMFLLCHALVSLGSYYHLLSLCLSNDHLLV